MVGITDADVDNYAPVVDMKFSFVLCQSLIPSMFGRAVDLNFIDLLGWMNLMRKIISGDKKPAFAEHDGLKMNDSFSAFFNQEIVRRGQTSSANGNCSARGKILVIFSALWMIFSCRSCSHCRSDGK